MAVIALTSAKGSPGVTTAALALTLTWQGRCVLTECDPAGGSIQAGYLAGALPADRGIRELAVAELRSEDLRRHWWGQLVDLQPPHRQRLLLPGITDPAQSATLRPVWERFAGFFSELETTDGYDVIVDCGRLAAPNLPWPVMLAADVVLLTLRPDLPGMSAAVPAVRALRTQLTEQGVGAGSLGLLVNGDGDQSDRTVARELAAPVVAKLPHDPRTATVLSRGGTVRTTSTLMRAAAGARSRIAAHVAARREVLRPDPAASS